MTTNEQLQSYIERVERLTEEKRHYQDNIKSVFAEAKANGFEVKAMKEIIKLRAMDDADREEREQLIEVYKRAVNL